MQHCVCLVLCCVAALGWSAQLISDAAACLRKSLIIAPLLVIKEEEVALLINTLKTNVWKYICVRSNQPWFRILHVKLECVDWELKPWSGFRKEVSPQMRNDIWAVLYDHIFWFRAGEGGILCQVDFNLLVNICMDFSVPLLGKLFSLFFISWIACRDVQSHFWGGQ